MNSAIDEMIECVEEFHASDSYAAIFGGDEVRVEDFGSSL